MSGRYQSGYGVTTEQHCDESRPDYQGGHSSDEATAVDRIGTGRLALIGRTSQLNDTLRGS